MSQMVETVVLTRPREQSEELAELLVSKGFQAFIMPTICTRILRPSESEVCILDKLIGAEYDWIVFSSARGVEFLDRLLGERGSRGLSPKIKVAVQGEKTKLAFTRLHGREPDLVPRQALSEVLLGELVDQKLGGQKVLLITPREGRETLLALKDHGALVERLCAYETLAVRPGAEVLDKFGGLNFNRTVVAFYSPSAFSSFLKVFEKKPSFLEQLKFASLGPVTSNAIRTAGYKPYLEASEPSDEALVSTLESARAGSIGAVPQK